MDTLRTSAILEKHLSDLVQHTVTLERDVAMLKRAFRIMSQQVDGDMLLKHEKDFLVNVVAVTNPFGVTDNNVIEH